MALSAESRSTLFQTLSPLVGDKATEEMLSYFPARDVEEPVTKEHLDRRVAEVETKIVALDGKVTTQMAELRAEIARFETRVSDEFRLQQRWIIGLGIALTTVVVSVSAIFH